MWGPVGMQIGGVALALAGLAAAPPARGKILLVPIVAGADARLLPLALAQGATMVGAGPLPSSYVVYGVRARLTGAMWGAGVAMLAAPAAGCGAPRGSNA